jgi:phosphonate degradation associated HDIG domain protein
MLPATIVSEIMYLFEAYGAEDYDGEPVSHTAHMVQCGMLALHHSGDPELVIGAFLHDIGHLLKHTQATTTMGNFGVADHEGIGAGFLRQQGFSDRVCAIVGGHVAAKRYLVVTDDAYCKRLSPASLETLRWQGGPLQALEIDAFEKNPFFNDIIAVRHWDEAAKDTEAQLAPLHYFEQLMINHLTLQQHAAAHSTRSF